MMRPAPAGTVRREKPAGADSRTFVLSESTVPPGWIDAKKFNENQNRIPHEGLAKYAGQCIAWKLDGTRILASGNTTDEVDARLLAMGIKLSETVPDYVDPPEITGWI